MKSKYFITLADLPPSPFDEERLSWYEELFTTYILTEDDVKMVKDGRLSKDYKKALKNLEKYNFDVFIRNMYNDPDYFSNHSFKNGSNYGSPYELDEREITTEFQDYKNVTGFYMADEPFMKEFDLHKEFANMDSLKKLVDYKNKYYPSAFFHMNMVPSQSYDHYYFANKDGTMLTYDDFINYYTENIIKNLLDGGKSICLDNYPFVHKDYIDPSYLDDLLAVSNITRDYNLSTSKKATFGVCIQTFHAKSMTDSSISRDIVSSQEISFQIFTSVALGARLLEYFCFQCFPDTEGAILDKNKNKRIFDLVKIANDKTLHFGEYLLSSIYQGAFFIRNPNPYLAYKSHISSKRFVAVPDFIKNIITNGDVLCGYFINGNEKQLVIVNFSDPIKERQVDIEIELKQNSSIYVLTPDKNVDKKEEKIIKQTISYGEAILLGIK